MDNNIQELLAPPISLSLETVIDGTKFYSSDSLKEKFVEAFVKSSKGKKIAGQIKILVDKNIILPCYRAKNLGSFIVKKFTRDPEKYILGFYHIEEKKVIILIGNSTSLIGTSSNNELISTTLHECMHLVSGRNFSKFTSTFSKYLEAYYSSFVTYYLKVGKPDPKSVKTLVKYIINLEKRGMQYANKDLGNYYRLIAKLFENKTVLAKEDFVQRVTDLVVALKLMIMHMPSLLNNMRKYRMLFRALDESYYSAFGKKNIYTTPLQELVAVSEVACVFVEMRPHDSVIKKLFKIIA